MNQNYNSNKTNQEEDLDIDFESLDLPDLSFDSSDENYDIGLTNEELSEVLEPPSPIELDAEEEHPVALSDDELDKEDELKIEPIVIDEAEDIQSEEIKELDDEPISLSDNELDNILSETPDDIEEISVEKEKENDLLLSDDELANKIISDAEEISLPPLAEVEMEEDTISLTPEELEDIVSNQDIQTISNELKSELEQETTEIEQTSELDNIEIPEPIFESDTEETISLTDDELKNIVGELEETEDITVPEPEVYDLKQERREQLTDDLEKETGIKKEELKKIIAYLDSLFDKLPEDAIREFSRSEYFNLYKKVIESLGIYPPE